MYEYSYFYVFFETVALLTYGYVSGPFKGYIVRYGYDPAQHPESRFLQVLHFRLNARDFNSIKDRLNAHVGPSGVGKLIDLDTMTIYNDTNMEVCLFR
jgi:hypothetical protein